jgi:hypothetical protein
MRFRLTYEGDLRPTQRDPEANQKEPLAAHKHNIRKTFHLQLKQLWATNKFLRNHKLSRNAMRPSRPVADESSYWGTEETFKLVVEPSFHNECTQAPDLTHFPASPLPLSPADSIG